MGAARAWNGRKATARGWLLALVAFLLAPAIVLASPAGPAEALVPPPVITPAIAEALGIGTSDALAGTIGLTCATGVGCAAIGVGLLGLGLYATKDTWLPWVKNAWNAASEGASGPSATPAFAAGMNGNCWGTGTLSWLRLPGVANTGDGGTIDFTYPQPQTCVNAQGVDQGGGLYLRARIKVDITCKNLTTGASASNYWVIGNGNLPNCNETFGQGSGYTEMSAVTVESCIAGTGPYCQDTNVFYNSVSWAGETPASGTLLTTIVHCVNANGSQHADVTLSGPGSRGFPMPSCSAALGDGWHGVGVETTQCRADVPAGTSSANGAMGQCLRIEKADRDDAAYPECDEQGTVCKLQIFVDGQPCHVGTADCLDWATQATQAPSRYACHYGQYVVPLSNCSALEYNYAPGPTPVTDPGQTDGDPQTGSPRPGTSTQPTPSPTTTGQPSPGTGGFPTTGTNPSTGDGPQSDNCLTSGWSWNPVSWVYVPVKCALTWAFVPKSSTLAELSSVKDDALARQPFVFATSAVGQLGGLASPGSSCYTFSADFPAPIGHIKGPDSCGPDPVTGQLQTYRPLLLAAIYVACFAPLAWWAWRQYAPASQGTA